MTVNSIASSEPLERLALLVAQISVANRVPSGALERLLGRLYQLLQSPERPKDHGFNSLNMDTMRERTYFELVKCLDEFRFLSELDTRYTNTVKDTSRDTVVNTRTEQMADAAWTMRLKSQRGVDPGLQQYANKHVAVYNRKIVADGGDLTEVLHRAADECQVPISRIVMSYWGNPATLQSVMEGESV